MKKSLILSVLIISFALTLVSCNDSSVHKLLLQKTVEFNACSDGEVTPSQKTVLKDDCYGELPTPKRTGYIFLGWYTQEENGILITSESIVTDVGQETLYAHWKESSYTVSFDLGYEGGSEIPSSINVQYLGYYGALPSPQGDGYVFCGWKNDRGYDVYSYTISDYTCDHTLYAQWTQNYVITFVDDQYYTETTNEYIAGDIISGSGTRDAAASIVVTNGESCSLPNLNNTIKRVGYKFEGWKEKDGDGEVLTPASKFTPTKDSTVFKAVWSPNTVYVYLNTMGGTVTTNGKQVSFAEAYGELPTPEKTGFTFAGWYKDSEKITKDSIVKTVASHTLYATWTPNIYNINYLEQNGTAFDGTHGTKYPTTHTYNTATNLVAAQDKAGYKFDGWYTDSTCTDNKITVIGATSYTADITLYAKWSPKTWNITYKDAGNSAFTGQFSDTAPSKHTYDTETALINPSKTGYLFGGWYTESTCSVKEKKVSSLSKTGYTADITLYAKWIANTYSVVFDKNGADGTQVMPNQSFTYDQTVALSSNIYTKTGYAFIGWNTEANGSGTHYADCASIKNLTDTDGAKINLYAQWTNNTYTVEYNGNGSSGGSTASQSNHVFGSSQALTINGFVKTGYTFAGWNTESDGTGTSYTDGQSVNNLSSEAGATVTLYAKWTANTYTIVYSGNGNTGGSTASSSHTYDADKTLTENGYTRTGYTFDGWSTTADGSKTYDDKVSVKNLSSTNGATVTLYAKWTPISYTVLYDGNGNTGGSTDSSSHTFDSNKNLTANGFTRTGYTFAGWNTESDGTGTSYTDGQSVNNLSSKKDDTVTLYAKWTANTYSVIFDKNGADGTQIMPDQQFTYDETAKALSTNLFTKTGYKFIYWSSTKNGFKAYDDNAPVQNLSENPNGTVTLYAKWLANFYTIKFNANGSTTISDTTGSLEDLPAQYDTPIDLTANTITRTGYTFAGWNTAANGSGTSYTDGQTVNNLSSAVNGVVNLYAQWNPITYHVAFDNNTGTGTLATQDIKYDATVNLTSNNNAMTKTGYSFTGWNTNAAGDGTAYADGSSVKNLKETAGDTLTLYAQWSKNSYKVEFNNNGGSGSITAQNFTYDVAANLTVNNGSMTKTGYTFNGWNTSADGNGSSYTDGQSVCNLSAANGATVTLYAKWKANTYTITYADKGDSKPFSGQFTSSAPGTHTYDTLTTLATPSKTGYIFEGWYYKDSTSTYVKLTDGQLGKTTFTSDMTIYANWTPITYTIRFNANGDSTVAATGSIADLVATYDTPINLTKNETSGSNTIIARNYYDFAGWNTQADGNGYSYADEASVLNLANTQGAVINLYAKWTPQSWSITYKDAGDNALSADNAENVIATMPSAYSYGVTLKLQKPTKTGYTHAGWYTDSACSDSKIVTNYDLNGLSGNLVLYAKWIANQYDINYFNYDGTEFTGTHGSGYPTKHTYDSSTTLVDPTRTGYTFGGWYTSANGSTTKTSLGAKEYTAAINLYAKWTPIKYTISFDKNGADGTQTMSSHTQISYDANITLTGNTFTKTGYTFSGWAKKNDSTTADYADKATVSNLTTTDGATVTLYAIWTPITYSVSFNANYGSGTAGIGSMSNQAFTYDKSANLTSLGYQRPGYIFQGWSKTPSTTNYAFDYADKTSVSNLSSTQNATVTLYAIWKPITYTLVYKESDGSAFSGTNSSSLPSEHVFDASISMVEGKKPGYKCYWYSDVSCSDASKITDKASLETVCKNASGTTITLYAKWTEDTYTITYKKVIRYNENEADIIDYKTDTYTYGIDKTLETQDSIMLDGYTFAGWCKDYTKWTPDNSIEKLTKDNCNGEITLYAVFVKEFSIYSVGKFWAKYPVWNTSGNIFYMYSETETKWNETKLISTGGTYVLYNGHKLIIRSQSSFSYLFSNDSIYNEKRYEIFK